MLVSEPTERLAAWREESAWWKCSLERAPAAICLMVRLRLAFLATRSSSELTDEVWPRLRADGLSACLWWQVAPAEDDDGFLFWKNQTSSYTLRWRWRSSSNESAELLDRSCSALGESTAAGTRTGLYL